MTLNPAHIYPHTSYVEAQRKIDEEISQLQDRIISLKSTRNSYTPVSRLHPEILQEIFFFAHTSSERYEKGKASLLLTWISRYWRKLAHDTANLWAFIGFTDLEWIQTVLPRTKRCELQFYLCFAAPEAQDNWITLAPHCLGRLAQTISLQIINFKFGTENRCLLHPVPQWRNPAHSLVSLHLCSVRLPPNVFSGTSPSLQSLHLTGCEVDMTTFPPLPCLRELDIAFPPERYDIKEFFHVLSGVSATLEQLSIHYALDILSDDVELRRIEFDRLKVLSIKDDLHIIITFLLDRLSLPHLLDITMDMHIWNQSVVDALVSCRGLSRWEIDRLEVHCHSESPTSVVDLVIIEHQKSMLPDHHCKVPALELETPLRQIYTRLQIKTYPSAADWLGYFARLSTIRELQISQPTFERFISEIEHQSGGIQEKFFSGEHLGLPEQERLPCGREILTLHNLQVLDLGGRGKEWNSFFTPDNVNTMKGWLSWRKQFGLELGKLVIRGGPSYDWLSSKFGDCVDDFEFILLEKEGGSFGDSAERGDGMEE